MWSNYTPIKMLKNKEINKLSTHEKSWKKFKCALLRKEAHLKNLQYCMIPENYGDSKKVSGCQELRVEGGKNIRA